MWPDTLAYLGIVVFLLSYAMDGIIKLRVISIASSGVFLIYGIITVSYPTMIEQVLALPVNAYGLFKMLGLIRQSPTLADSLAASAESIDLGPQRRDITSMFTDIASFTTLAECLEPSIIGPLLNEYLTGMTEIVFDHGGALVKIIGDALNVLFGAPADQPDHAARAVACALALDAYAQDFSARWREKGVTVGITRIGVCAGPALVGSLGGGRFFDYTAYGDTINIAARLEAANKQLGTRICVSGSVVERIPEFRGRPVGNVILRGRHEALLAHEPLTPERHADARTAVYLDAYSKAEACDPGALSSFAVLLGQDGGDGLVSFHLKRLLAGASGVSVALD